MGLFKDLRKLSKQAKELGREQGLDTGVLGMLKSAPGMIQQATEALDQIQAGKADSDRLRAEGVPARARLLAVKDTGMTVGGSAVGAAPENPVAELQLEVHQDGRQPYTATVHQMVPRLAVARLVPGTELPVLVDRHDRDRLIVDWDTPV